MQKLAFLAVLFIAQIFAIQAQTTVQINYAGDSQNVFCPSPSWVYFTLGGQAGGYDPSVDSADIHVNFGDGSDTAFTIPLWGNTTTAWFSEGLSHLYTSSGFYSTVFSVVMPDNNTDTMIVNNDVLVGDTCGNISGNVYVDQNTDCVFNGIDQTIPYQLVYLYDAGTGVLLNTTYTNFNGDYWFNVPTGTNYEISLGTTLSNVFNVTCPSGGIYTTTAPASNLDFSLDCNTTGFDLATNGYLNGFVPGMTSSLYAFGYNQSCQPKSGQLKVVSSDPLLTNVSTNFTTTPDAINGDTLFFDFTNLYFDPNMSWTGGIISASLKFDVDTNATIGDTICIDLYICPEAGDNDNSNNHVQLCRPVVTSYDPNNKQVTPLGKGNVGNILANRKMTYTINFQNTGTAEAINVYLRDTIDTSVLDLSSLQILATSHKLTRVSTLDQHVMKFNFDNIHLADSATNEPESKGFITYSINQVENLPVGTTIENSAGIYFDYNAPIITNTALNTIYLPNVITALDPPTLVLPVDGSLDVETQVQFDWDNVMHASSYELQWGTDPNFVGADSKITPQSQYTVSGLTPAEIYFWRVRAKNTTLALTSPWSSTWDFITQNDGTGIADPESELNMVIYPNPSNGNFNLVLDQAGNYELRIRNAIGQLVLQKTIQSPASIELDLREEPAGTYFLELQGDQQLHRSKLMKY